MQNKQKKIAILIPEFPGQTHNFFWREINALKSYGAEVLLLSTQRPPLGVQSPSWSSSAINETYYCYPLPIRDYLYSLFNLFTSLKMFLCCSRLLLSSALNRKSGESLVGLVGLMLIGIHLGRMLQHKGIQHLHVHSCANAANLALFATACEGVKYSMTLHNPLAIWGGNQSNKWKHAEFGIVIADWLMKDLNYQLHHYLPPLLFIAPMGVDIQLFKRNYKYEPYVTGILKIFSCGRLNLAKGFVPLLNSIKLLKLCGLEVSLSIAGEDDSGGHGFRKVIEKKIDELDLSNNVILLGAISEEQVRDELEKSHIFVLASLEEPLGVAIMEAMAMEVPVIATNSGGVPSLVSEGLNGLLVKPSCSQSLADAISKLAHDHELAQKFSMNGRARIVSDFHHKLSAKIIFENS